MFATLPMENQPSSASPKLLGTSQYLISNDQITINIDTISNERPLGDISGTLAIELWALKQPYAGGEFSGECLAATEIGEVFGQHYLSNCHLLLNFREPAIGSWYLCLMLREWTANGYVTRDQINFDQPYTQSWKPELVKTGLDNVVNMPVADNDKVDNPAEDNSEVLAESTAADMEVAAKHPGKVNAQLANKPALKASETLVNLNQASIDEIAAVKNISKKLAINIVNARPLASFDELLQVKGMGEKLLARVRQLIQL